MEPHPKEFPPFYGPYGPSNIECSCGFRYLDDQQLAGKPDSYRINHLTSIVNSRQDHYAEVYSEYPYDRIRVTFDSKLSDEQNAHIIIKRWPRFNQQMYDNLVSLVRSYRPYAALDDKWFKTDYDILVDQIMRWKEVNN